MIPHKGFAKKGAEIDLLLEFKQGLSLEDRAIVGKGMKSLDEQALGAGLDRNVTDGRQGESLVRPEIMKDTTSQRVTFQFVMDSRVHFRFETLDSNTGLVNNRGGTLNCLGAFSVQAAGEQSSLLRQRAIHSRH